MEMHTRLSSDNSTIAAASLISDAGAAAAAALPVGDVAVLAAIAALLLLFTSIRHNNPFKLLFHTLRLTNDV
jgi:hypothetical protein